MNKNQKNDLKSKTPPKTISNNNCSSLTNTNIEKLPNK
jgi:hypothetical protein